MLSDLLGDLPLPDLMLILGAVVAGLVMFAIVLLAMRALPRRVSSDRQAVQRAEQLIRERPEPPETVLIGEAAPGPEAPSPSDAPGHPAGPGSSLEAGPAAPAPPAPPEPDLQPAAVPASAPLPVALPVALVETPAARAAVEAPAAAAVTDLAPAPELETLSPADAARYGAPDQDMVALLTLAERRWPSLGQILQALAERLGELPPAAVEAPETLGQPLGPAPLGFAIGPAHFQIRGIDKPLPWYRLQEACQRADHWPDALRAMKHHRALIELRLKSTEVSAAVRVGTLVTLSAVAAVTGEVAQATGFYWPAGEVVHPVRSAIAQVQSIARGEIPVGLWIDVAGWSQGDDRGIRSRGLAPFLGLELESEPLTHHTTAQARSLALDALATLLERAQPPGHGSTLSLADGRRLFFTHGPSRFDETRTTLRVTFL